jgi:predicted AAA+ superfamily ATPase
MLKRNWNLKLKIVLGLVKRLLKEIQDRGKITLFNKQVEENEYLFLNGEDPAVRRLVLNPKLDQLKNTIVNFKIIFIDEAQRIDNMGLILKLITD